MVPNSDNLLHLSVKGTRFKQVHSITTMIISVIDVIAFIILLIHGKQTHVIDSTAASIP